MQSGLQRKHHQQQQQMNSGLMRYRSAPSSYLASIADDRGGFDLHPRPSSPDTERIIAQLMSEESSPPSPEFDEIPASSPAALGADARAQEFAPPKHEAETVQLPVMYQNSCRPPLPSQNPAAVAATGSEMDVSAASYRAVASMSVDNQAKLSVSNNSTLTRHSSSPAGLFSHPNMENGYGMRRGVADIGSVNGTGGRATFSASTLKGQINFSSGLMTHMSNTGNKRLGASSNAENNGNFHEGHRGSNDSYLTGFPVGSWEDHRVFSEQFTGLKRVRDDDRKMFSGLNALESPHGERGDHAPTLLSRHMSLPKTSAEMASVEKYLQFQDSVPCKIRAKRGCATHPRSIAERVRRTRISERMRKLQELVPNMDKQTSTADMLDLAVEYIKELQKQVNMLAESSASCTCSNNSKS